MELKLEYPWWLGGASQKCTMLSVVITDTNFAAGFISSPILSLLMSDQGIACGYPFCVRCASFFFFEKPE